MTPHDSIEEEDRIEKENTVLKGLVMTDKLTVGKIEFECSSEAVSQFFQEKRRDDLKRIKEILDSFHLDETIVDAVIKKLQDS